MDKTVFAEKFAQLGLDEKSLNEHKEYYLQIINKFEPQSQKILLTEMELMVQVANLMANILASDELYVYLDGIANNFVDEEMGWFSRYPKLGLDGFMGGMAEKAHITRFFLPYIEKRDYANLHAKPQLEVIIGLFADVINTNEQKLWIIAFHFIYLHLIERFSIQWLNMYPQFENIKSKDQAIDIYVHLSLEDGQKGKAAKYDRKYNRFAFSCWLFFECIDCSTLCTICLHTDEEIVKRT